MAKLTVETQADRDAAAADALRAQRDAKLRETDWTQMPDSPLSAADKAKWATYRRSLRDLPANTPDPHSPKWPTPPGKLNE